MHERWRRLWPWVKLLLAVAVIGGVVWQFVQILGSAELQENPPPMRPGWMAVCVACYVAAFAFPATYWQHLLGVTGTRPPLAAALNAYYVGHLGKYVPFKAWALVLRTMLIYPYGVRPGIAVATAIYETLTFMAAGALLAVLLLTVCTLNEDKRWLAAGLLLGAGWPLIPGVYNRIVDRLTALARKAAARQSGAEKDIADLPRLRARTLLFGLAWTACGWCAMGMSLWALIQAVIPEPTPWTWDAWGRCTAFVALGYVAGFLILFTPGGLGARELILKPLVVSELALAPLVSAEYADKLAWWVVFWLRLLYIMTEVILAGAAYLLALALAPRPVSLASSAEPGTGDLGHLA
jgi:glycosyltransferase 2 family protein